MDKYGAPRRTEYRIIVENLSTRVSWQVGRNRTFVPTLHSIGHLDARSLRYRTKQYSLYSKENPDAGNL